jgi:hypothetical protein
VIFVFEPDIQPFIISGTMHLLRKGTDPGNPYSFTINGVYPEDTGLYSCVAGNILGETVETAYLLISGSRVCRTSSSWIILAGVMCTLGKGVVDWIFMIVIQLMMLISIISVKSNLIK